MGTEKSRESGQVSLSKLTAEMILDFEQADVGEFCFKMQLTDFSLKKHSYRGNVSIRGHFYEQHAENGYSRMSKIAL